MQIALPVAAFLALPLAFPVASAQSTRARQVAAPPSDVLRGVVRLPDPASTAVACEAALLPARFQRAGHDAGGGAWFAEWTYPVERDGALTLLCVSPDARGWRLTGAPVGRPLRPLEETHKIARDVALAGDALPGFVVDRREIHGVTAGTWRFRVEAAESSPGWLLATASAELRAEAYVATQRLVAGAPIAIVAGASGADLGRVERARAVLAHQGVERELALHDDGLHEDRLAGDGWFGAFVPEDVRGPVEARVDLEGTTLAGAAFLRSSPLAFTVHERPLALDGTARATELDGGRLRIAIAATPLGPERKLQVAAEVWGRDAQGRDAPACWLARMVAPEPRGAGWELALALDLDWLASSGVGAPLELRAVRVQDPDSGAVLDDAAQVPLEVLGTPVPQAPRAGTGVVTARMLTGDATFVLGQAPPPEYPSQRALMLVHGYCSSASIWPAADFTAPKLEFLDPNANRTHDQFAQLLAQRGAAAHLASFGIVGHSQGGPAALHLLTYYTSGLDMAAGGRRIQSVASPYLGTPLASLGGFACGVNNDMTPSGASTWLAGIPSWARAEVFTWTVANSGAACNSLTSLFLTDPEDGTVEKMRGELPGGNNMGHTVGWCHTTGMSNPAVYNDHARNLLMNAAAAR